MIVPAFVPFTLPDRYSGISIPPSNVSLYYEVIAIVARFGKVQVQVLVTGS